MDISDTSDLVRRITKVSGGFKAGSFREDTFGGGYFLKRTPSEEDTLRRIPPEKDALCTLCPVSLWMQRPAGEGCRNTSTSSCLRKGASVFGIFGYPHNTTPDT
ncbi:MAG TPA: hypothetical protein GXZ88_00825 [Firmicutes bacterium]|nr:hypothetical protein [Candidatus Fermentithermobacillaceae bacterium]